MEKLKIMETVEAREVIDMLKISKDKIDGNMLEYMKNYEKSLDEVIAELELEYEEV